MNLHPKVHCSSEKEGLASLDLREDKQCRISGCLCDLEFTTNLMKDFNMEGTGWSEGEKKQKLLN